MRNEQEGGGKSMQQGVVNRGWWSPNQIRTTTRGERRGVWPQPQSRDVASRVGKRLENKTQIHEGVDTHDSSRFF